MAVSIGTCDEQHEDDLLDIPSKRFKSDKTDDNKLSEFLSWCSSGGLTISRKVIKLMSRYQYEGGVVAGVNSSHGQLMTGKCRKNNSRCYTC